MFGGWPVPYIENYCLRSKFGILISHNWFSALTSIVNRFLNTTCIAYSRKIAYWSHKFNFVPCRNHSPKVESTEREQDNDTVATAHRDKAVVTSIASEDAALSETAENESILHADRSEFFVI